ncbi:hypothetical protein K474DRAFT_1769979 [Panus rudis PR-1116 ss-1]|nr:hypothetical protein K474DRAFT_1769979 [Panus rudis PR-1116 ss-1]
MELPTPTRHHNLWFSDGSVVLRADNTLFKVHMSQLSRHSIVFRDLFAMPQPVKAGSSSTSPTTDTLEESTYEGLPMLYLHDSARDLAHLLMAIYDGPVFGKNDRADFEVVSGILRLANKYVIELLRKKAVAHLSIAWPSSLDSWDAREDFGRIYEMSENKSRGYLYPSPIDVIKLAREIDEPSLLPSAFYDLSRYSFTQIYEPNEEDPLYPSSADATSEHALSPIDMQKLALGKESITQAISNFISSLTSPSPPHQSSLTHRRNLSSSSARNGLIGGKAICTTVTECRKDFLDLVDLATQHYIVDKEQGHSDPLFIAEEIGGLKIVEATEGDGCLACARSLEAWAAKERMKMWKMIPTWFRLESF